MKKLFIVFMIVVSMLLFAVPAMGDFGLDTFPLEPKAGRGTVEWNALPATVAIVSDIGFGAGAVVSSDGYIITAQHVIGSSLYVEVYYNDFTSTIGRIVGRHSIEDVDIAVIKVNTKKDLYHFSTPQFEGDPASWDFVLNPRQINIGDEVYLIGHPIGLTWSISKGVISAKRLWGDDGLKFLQVDAATNPGNSGGPMVNSNGQIVGILVFGIPAFLAEGLHFGISVESFGKEVIAIIEKDRERLNIITNVWEDETEEKEEPRPQQIIITLPDNTVTDKE